MKQASTWPRFSLSAMTAAAAWASALSATKTRPPPGGQVLPTADRISAPREATTLLSSPHPIDRGATA